MKVVNKHLFKVRRILVSVKEIIAFIKQQEYFGKKPENFCFFCSDFLRNSYLFNISLEEKTPFFIRCLYTKNIHLV